MTLTIPDFIPYLSIFEMNDLKLRNWSIVYVDDIEVSNEQDLIHIEALSRIPAADSLLDK